MENSTSGHKSRHLKRYLLSHPRYINTTNQQNNYQNIQEKYLDIRKHYEKEYETLCHIKKDYDEKKLLREKRIEDNDNITEGSYNDNYDVYDINQNQQSNYIKSNKSKRSNKSIDSNKNRRNKKNGILCDDSDDTLTNNTSLTEGDDNDNIDGTQSFFTTQDTNFEADISNLTSFSHTMDSISILHWNDEQQEQLEQLEQLEQEYNSIEVRREEEVEAGVMIPQIKGNINSSNKKLNNNSNVTNDSFTFKSTPSRPKSSSIRSNVNKSPRKTYSKVHSKI